MERCFRRPQDDNGRYSIDLPITVISSKQEMTATGSVPVAPNQKSERKRQKNTLEYLLKTGDIHNQDGSIVHEKPGAVLGSSALFVMGILY